MKIIHYKAIMLISALLTSNLYADCKTGKYDHFSESTDSSAIKQQKTIELVNNAVCFYQKNGLKESIKLFSDSNNPFCKNYEFGSMGVNVMTEDGVILASCKYPGLVGHNALSWQNPDGKFVNQELLEEVEKNPEGALTTQKVTNHNPLTGIPTTYKHFARLVDGLVFFSHIYNDIPPHKDLTPKEDIEKFQNAKNAKPIDLDNQDKAKEKM
ncbi:MAG: hypothetical protein H0X26_02910 [Alphaproteobacteria bacterium]|nr:hypothetical protein [Alphaproteobacteria bacterium]